MKLDLSYQELAYLREILQKENAVECLNHQDRFAKNILAKLQDIEDDIQSFFKDDKKDGECKVYNQNGKLNEHCFLKDDKLDGEFKSYYENGKLKNHCFYKDDKLDGEFKFYYDNGKLKNHCFYKDDKLDGEFKFYYYNGKLCRCSIFKNDIEIKKKVK